MDETANRLLYWAPRVLGIGFAAFISIFALDVFEEGRGIGETALALTMHLVPTAIVVALVAVSWRWEIVGGTVFIALGAAYILGAWGRFPISAYVAIAGPLFLTGGLFLVGGLRRVSPSSSA